MNENWDDEDEDDAWDNSADDDQDEPFDEDDASETVACPACGAEVYEDALRCPSCGEYVTHSTSFFAGRPWWWIALGIAGVLAVIVTSLIAGLGF
jgi:DNA-directed RNA polymerase subunit RPC12/RpoP